MPYLVFCTICVIWGSSFILMDRAAIAFPPVAVAFWRVVGGAVVLWLASILRRQSCALPRPFWIHVLLVAGLANAIPFVLQPYLISKFLGHGMMGMMIVFVPLLTIAVSVPLLGIRPTVRQMLGVLGGLICFGLIVADSQTKGISILHLGLALTVPLVYAFGNTYVKRYLHDVPPLPLTLWMLVVDSLLLLTWAWVREPSSLGARAMISGTDFVYGLASLVVLGIVATGFAMLLFNQLILHHGPLFAGMVTYVIPSGAVFIGSLDGEPVSLPQIFALIGALAMVALVQYRAAGHGSASPVTQTAREFEHD